MCWTLSSSGYVDDDGIDDESKNSDNKNDHDGGGNVNNSKSNGPLCHK